MKKYIGVLVFLLGLGACNLNISLNPQLTATAGVISNANVFVVLHPSLPLSSDTYVINTSAAMNTVDAFTVTNDHNLTFGLAISNFGYAYAADDTYWTMYVFDTNYSTTNAVLVISSVQGKTAVYSCNYFDISPADQNLTVVKDMDFFNTNVSSGKVYGINVFAVSGGNNYFGTALLNVQ